MLLTQHHPQQQQLLVCQARMCIEPTEPVNDNIITTEKLLSKKSCVNTEDKCNGGYKPYSYGIKDINPDTERPYLDSEKTQKENVIPEML